MQITTLHDSTEIAYRLEGVPEGTPIVFLHGYACTGLDWEPTAEALSDHYRTLVFDFRAHSRSAPTQMPLTLDTLVDDTHELITRFALERPVLVGHSMGGMVALEYTLRYPDEVRGLVMAEAFPHLYSVSNVFGPAEDPVNDPYGYGSVFDHQTPETVIQRVRKQMSEGVERLPASLFRSLLDFDRRARLNELSIPVMLLIGDRRTFTEKNLASLVDRLGYGALSNLEVELVSSHHFVMLEQPYQTLFVMHRFLKQFNDQD